MGQRSDWWQVPQTLWRTLEYLHLDATKIIQSAGVSDELLSDRSYTIDTKAGFSIWRALEKHVNDPDFSLKFLSAANIAGRDATFLAAHHARSLRDALRNLSRFKGLYTPVRLAHAEADGLFHATRSWPTTEEPEPNISVDYSFAEYVGLARIGTGKRITAVRVELARKGPHLPAFEEYFGCRIKYRAAQDRLVLRSADLDTPFVSHNSDILDYVSAGLDAEMQSRNLRGSFRDQTRQAMLATIGNRDFDLEALAAKLGLSVRSLQRRLHDLDTTYATLLRETRREVAIRLLANSRKTLQQIAVDVGYEEVTSFSRAFRTWEGTSPGEWRRTLATTPLPAPYRAKEASSG